MKLFKKRVWHGHTYRMEQTLLEQNIEERSRAAAEMIVDDPVMILLWDNVIDMLGWVFDGEEVV